MADILDNALIPALAEAAQITPRDYLSAIKTICFPNGAASDTQVLVLLQTAHKYDLNPLMKEIYAFVDKGGRMQVIVGVDGWIKIANRESAYDGCEFEYEHTDKGELVAVTCRIFRKDQAHATVVTEYLSECARPTEPWKSKHRMLRHKAFVQTVRYAFGTAGIADQDEAERIEEIHNGAPAVETTATRAEDNSDSAASSPRPADAAGAAPVEGSPPAPPTAASTGGDQKPKRGRPRKLDVVPDAPTNGKTYGAGTVEEQTAGDLASFIAAHNVPQTRINMALTKAGVERMDQLSNEQSAAILAQFEKSYA